MGCDGVVGWLMVWAYHSRLHVVQVDMKARNIALFAPCPGLLPGRFLVLGIVKQVE